MGEGEKGIELISVLFWGGGGGKSQSTNLSTRDCFRSRRLAIFKGKDSRTQRFPVNAITLGVELRVQCVCVVRALYQISSP